MGCATSCCASSKPDAKTTEDRHAKPDAKPTADDVLETQLNPGGGAMDQQTFNDVVVELGLQRIAADMSGDELKELEDYIKSLKERQTSMTGFNLCKDHDKILRGKPPPEEKPAKAASRSKMHRELLLKPSITQSVLDEMDSATAKMQPSARETEDMLFAFHLYSRNEIYREFNRDHRELRPELWAAVSNTMRCAVEHARSPDDDVTLYRGDTRDMYTLRKGQLDCFSQYTSASRIRSVAESFSEGKWMFEITGVPHTHCATIKHASKYPDEDEVLIAPGSTFCVESVDESTTPKVVRLRFGKNGTQAECEWCLLEREFSTSRLITDSSKITDFGKALAGRAPGRPRADGDRPLIDGPCFQCFDKNSQLLDGTGMKRPLLVSAAGRGAVAMVDLLLDRFGLDVDVARRFTVSDHATQALEAALHSPLGTPGRADCVAAIIGNCVLHRTSPSSTFKTVVSPLQLDALLREPELERIAELGQNYLNLPSSKPRVVSVSTEQLVLSIPWADAKGETHQAVPSWMKDAALCSDAINHDKIRFEVDAFSVDAGAPEVAGSQEIDAPYHSWPRAAEDISTEQSPSGGVLLKMPNNLPPLASKLCVLRVRIAEGQFVAGSAAKSYSCNQKSLWSLRSDANDWEDAEVARKAAEAEAKAAAEGKAAAEAKEAEDAEAARKLDEAAAEAAKAAADAKAVAEAAAQAAAEAKAAAKGKAAAEAKAADDKLWIFIEKWFNLRFVIQSHKRSLYAFAAAGLIEIGARGSSFGVRSLELTVKNLASCPLKMLVPRGSWFHNRTPFHQPLVTIRDCWIEIEPGALATVELDAFCGIRTYGCPDRDEMELSPYVFDGDDVMMSQSKVWDYFSPFVPVIPKEQQPSNPASSVMPNPQLDKEAEIAVLKDMRDQEHKDAAAQAEAKRKIDGLRNRRSSFSRFMVPPTTFNNVKDVTRGQPKAQERVDLSKWRDGQPPSTTPKHNPQAQPPSAPSGEMHS